MKKLLSLAIGLMVASGIAVANTAKKKDHKKKGKIVPVATANPESAPAAPTK
jgi:hypothetical protein